MIRVTPTATVRQVTADDWGVSFDYFDTVGVRHDAALSTREALRKALGADLAAAPPPPGAIVVRTGDVSPLPLGTPITLEDGSSATAGQDLPLGYHAAEISGRVIQLIVAPRTAVRTDGLRTWGWAIQLYAARSRRSWGIGDLADLATFNQRAAALGAGMTLVNPLHAATPVAPMQPSPYFPTTRCFRNPIYVSVENTPGYSDLAADVASFAASARRLLANRRIDRDQVWKEKLAALERVWDRFAARGASVDRARYNAFRSYCHDNDPLLTEWAAFCVLCEQHGADWREWPAAMRSHSAGAVADVVRKHSHRVGLHRFLQWLVDGQLANAGRRITLMADLAVGVDRAGFDTWRWPSSFCSELSIGAPPDDFNTQGQDWGLPPWNHWGLRADGYDAFIATVRASFRHAGALRIDHVMGLFRIWAIPPNSPPTEGCYVYLPFQDLLGIIALESHRHNAYVVGEDLGTVEPYVREALSRDEILSYRLVQFEPGLTAELQEKAMAAFTTHDLPTVAGFWTGADLVDTTRIGLKPNLEGITAIRQKLADFAGIDAPEPGPDAFASLEKVTEAVYDDLATAPSRVLSATLEDALGVEQRPNVPGTVDEWPNWRLALPMPLEDILEHRGVIATAAALHRR